MDGTARGDAATARASLPERQREALELRELRGLSYEEIAASMGTTRECVSQLIAHSWINLYDELEGTILASVAPSAECERALGLTAAREDGELDPESADAHWLDAHVEDCDRCRRGVEEIHEAMRRCRTSATAAVSRRRRLPLVAGLVALLLLAGAAAAFVRDEPPPASVDRAVGAAEPLGRGDDPDGGERKKQKAKGGSQASRTTKPRGAEESEAAATAAAPIAPPTGSPASEPAPRPADPQGNADVEPTQRTSSPDPRPKPKPPAAPTSTPAPPSPPAAEPAPVEEADDGPPYGREPPGKAVGHEPG